MRRINAASLATINPMVRADRETAGKDGDVTEMFAEAIQVPACVLPAAAEPLPAPVLAIADLALVTGPSAAEPEPARPTWHERMTRAIAARFRRAPRDETLEDAKERIERFHARRSGPGF